MPKATTRPAASITNKYIIKRTSPFLLHVINYILYNMPLAELLYDVPFILSIDS